MSAGLGLFVAFHVGRLGLAEHPQELGILAQVHPLHLVLDQTSGESHPTNIVTGVSLDSYPVTTLERNMGAVAVKAAAGVLEEHLDKVKVIVGDVIKPVVAGEVATPHICVSARAAACTGIALHAGISSLLGKFR